MAQQVNPKLPQQKSYEADEVVKTVFNEKSQSANIKQVYKVKATELTPQIMLGTQWQAHDTKTMKEFGVTHLISCMKDDWGFVHNLKKLDETRVEMEDIDDLEKGQNADTLPIHQVRNTDSEPQHLYSLKL